MDQYENQKRQSRPEIYILLTMGVRPDVLIKRGYSEATVYAYNRKVKDVKDRLNELLTTNP